MQYDDGSSKIPAYTSTVNNTYATKKTMKYNQQHNTMQTSTRKSSLQSPPMQYRGNQPINVMQSPGGNSALRTLPKRKRRKNPAVRQRGVAKKRIKKRKKRGW